MLKKLICMLFVILLCGCGGNNTRRSKTDKFRISEKPVTYTVFMNIPKNYNIFDEAAKLTNVSLKPVIQTDMINESQAFMIMMSAGNLPDIIMHRSTQDFFIYGKEKFIDIGKYSNRYMPDFENYISDKENIQNSMVAPDGGMYFVPQTEDTAEKICLFVRSDWLKKLNLSVPQNAVEYENVLRAFLNGDPNGNGIKDEIPYTSFHMNNDNIYGIEVLYSLWNAYPSWYAENGIVKYGPAQPEFKNAINALCRWYAEGLIDREIFTFGDGNASEKLNNCGMLFENLVSAANLKLSENSFSAVQPCAPILKMHNCVPYGWGISKNCKDILTAVQYFNFWFTDKGRKLANYGISDNPSAISEIIESGAQSDFGYPRDYDFARIFYGDEEKKAARLSDSSVFYMRLPFSLQYTEDNFSDYMRMYNETEAYVMECVKKWVMGVENINNRYNDFLNDLNRLGLNEMTEIQQQTYNKSIEVTP